jgi:prepilin-type N-terminal cleavage/methylation domain-containing protein
MKSKAFTHASLSERKSSAGFTLIEVIVAIFLLTVGIVGAFTLVQRTITFTSITSSRLEAAYLAQEGIEIVRNIRDSNWIARDSWDEGLSVGDWEADYKAQNLSQAYAGNFLNIDDTGFYTYSSGTPTKFKRKITISKDTDILKVSVLIEWQERGITYQFTAQENLYKWFPSE